MEATKGALAPALVRTASRKPSGSTPEDLRQYHLDAIAGAIVHELGHRTGAIEDSRLIRLQ